MSMKKFTKKMLAIVAAGAMTMGLAMPAMAAEGTTADTVNNAKEAYISKTYNTEVGKAETFSFTDAEGKYSLSGSIFLHCANKPDFSDFNNMIYGHHMEKHMMFGDVGLFTDKEYFDEHPYGNLFFDGKDHGIEFYALIQADAYNERLFSVSSEEPEAKQAYLQEISDNALYKRNFELTENDHLVLLITCTSEMTNGRNILVGRLTDQVYPEKEKAKNLGTGIDKLKEKMIQVPVIYWILLLIIVLLLIDRKLKKKGKKKHENP